MNYSEEKVRIYEIMSGKQPVYKVRSFTAEIFFSHLNLNLMKLPVCCKLCIIYDKLTD